MTAKQKRIIKRKAQRTAILTFLYAAEIIIASAPAAVLAAILVPVLTAQRGYFACGSEWFAIIGAFYIAYLHIHKRVCNEIFGGEEKKR